MVFMLVPPAFLTLFTGLLVRFVRIGAVYLYNTPYGWKLLLFITMSLLPVTNIGSWRKTRTCLQMQGALNALTLCCLESVELCTWNTEMPCHGRQGKVLCAMDGA